VWYPVSILANGTELRASFDSQELVVAGASGAIAEMALIGAINLIYGSTDSGTYDDNFLPNAAYGGLYDDVAINDLSGTTDNALPGFIRALPATYTVAATAGWTDTANLDDANPATQAGANGTLELDVEDTPVAYTGVEGVNVFVQNIEGVGEASVMTATVDNGAAVSDNDTVAAALLPSDDVAKLYGKASEGGDWTAAEWDSAKVKLTVTP